jgi:hypothetical protein
MHFPRQTDTHIPQEEHLRKNSSLSTAPGGNTLIGRFGDCLGAIIANPPSVVFSTPAAATATERDFTASLLVIPSTFSSSFSHFGAEKQALQLPQPFPILCFETENLESSVKRVPIGHIQLHQIRPLPTAASIRTTAAAPRAGGKSVIDFPKMAYGDKNQARPKKPKKARQMQIAKTVHLIIFCDLLSGRRVQTLRTFVFGWKIKLTTD